MHPLQSQRPHARADPPTGLKEWQSSITSPSSESHASQIAYPARFNPPGHGSSPRLHAVATYLKTFQALSYERLQPALSDLFGLRLSQGGLMNLLRGAQSHFRPGREEAVSTLRRTTVVA